MTLLRNVTFDVRNLLKLSPTHTISQSNFHLSKKTDVLTGQKFKNEDVFYQCLHNGVQIKSIMDSLPIVKSSLIKCKEAEECKEAIDWFSRVFDYIVPYGKRHRVSTIVRTFETINPDAPIHDLLRAHAVGWSLELLQAAALIADDIEDHGVHRRGKPSWHTLPDVQMIAVNDLMILQNSAFTTINNFCEGHPCHMNVLKLMSETARLTGV
jgi:geranylgeranyl pyrophosphate synthase